MALAPAASAQEPEGGEELSDDTEECIEQAEEADDPEACQEAPSPILPATDELIWGSISFAVLLFLLWKFAYPPVKKGMDDRTERIRAELEAADAAKSEAQAVLDEYQAQLADAKAEAGRIIEEARQAADAIKRDQEARLQAELAELRQRAVADIERPRPRPWPTCGARSRSWPSAPPRPWCSATSTRRRRPSSSRTTSTRWRRSAHERRATTPTRYAE